MRGSLYLESGSEIRTAHQRSDQRPHDDAILADVDLCYRGGIVNHRCIVVGYPCLSMSGAVRQEKKRVRIDADACVSRPCRRNSTSANPASWKQPLTPRRCPMS